MLVSIFGLKIALAYAVLGLIIAICTTGIILVGYGFNLFQKLFL